MRIWPWRGRQVNQPPEGSTLPPIPQPADPPTAERLASANFSISGSGGVIPWPVRAASEWAWRFLVIAAAVAVVLYVLATFRLIVFPVLAALLVTALLQPGVRRLKTAGLPRGLAAAIVFTSGIVVLVLAVTVIGGLFADGLRDISSSATEGIETIRTWLTTGPLNLSEGQLDSFATDIRTAIQENRQQLVTGALNTATVTAEIIAGILLTLFVTFFFLYDGERIWRWVVRLFPRAASRDVAEAGKRAWRTLGGYVRGTLLVALFDGVFTLVVLLILRVPLAVPLSALVFLGAFLPLVGATVTGAIAVLVALVTQGLDIALLVLAGVIAVQQIEGHVLQPLLLGRLVRLHPLAVVLAITSGALVAGIGGAIIAVPLVAVINTIAQYFAHRGTPEVKPQPGAP